MKKLILLSLLTLLAVFGASFVASAAGQGERETVFLTKHSRDMKHSSGCMIVAAAAVCFWQARVERSAGEKTGPCVRLVLAPPAQCSRFSDRIQLPDDSDGDSGASDTSVHLSPGDSPRPLFGAQALYGLELARLSAVSVAAGIKFPAAPDEAPQILVWLASYLEVRAGPAAA